MSANETSRTFAIGLSLLASLLAVGELAGAQVAPPGRKIVLLAGALDNGHPKGTHEYEESVLLLQRCLDTSTNLSGIKTEVHFKGWPQDPATLDDADTIVVIGNGSDRNEQDHPLMVGDRLAVIERQMKRGCGLVLIHWTTFAPKARAGEKYLEWIGGFFDYESGTDHPQHWRSRIQHFTSTPRPATAEHPICRGLRPFEVREEFYYRIVFRENDPRLQPILVTRAPGEAPEQIVAWAVSRKDGGRGFGFTGGHYCENWRIDSFRKLILNAIVWTAKAEVPAGGVASNLSAPGRDRITHSFLAAGAETRMVAGDGETVWRFPKSTRDGWVLPNGNILLAVSKDKDYPGGAILEVTRSGQTVFEWKGTQSEVNTAQPLPNGAILATEAGARPRLLEINRQGKVVVEVPLICQTTNYHMESRMARKLPNGNYLVPQLLDKVVREYDPAGKVVWEVQTPNWAFTAIRLPNGHTLINCTYGNLSLEVDQEGKSVWEFSNRDLPEPFIKDACGGQRLPNGNTVICAYGIGAGRTKLLEVTPDKKVVWTYTDESPHGIHEVQILDTNGKPVEGMPLR